MNKIAMHLIGEMASRRCREYITIIIIIMTIVMHWNGQNVRELNFNG